MQDQDDKSERSENPNLNDRFVYLMKRFLQKEATDDEVQELNHLVQNGMEARFQAFFDQVYLEDSDTEKLPEKVREEVLTNILGRSVAAERSDERRSAFYRSWATAAAIFLALSLGLWLALSRQSNVMEALVSEEVATDFQVFKGKQFVELPDGSTVLMNEGSELSYSKEGFNGNSREVSLKGEAYFDVAHKSASVFSVRTGEVVTRVLGTAFNISANQDKVSVTVTRGLVEVGGPDRVYTRVKPDEKVTVDTRTNQFETNLINAEADISWKKSMLIFNSITLAEAFSLIEEHYKVTITFAESELNTCQITASFLNGEDLDTVLKVITEMSAASYKVDGRDVYITGGNCN